MLGGELIYQTSDRYGTIEVVDYFNELRALHFGNATQQSACLLCNPDFLVHKYAQAMLLPLCWLNAKRVLVLGLGAGSIVKYLHQYHQEITIDAIELRPKVVEIATEYFQFPEPSKHLNIYIDSAADWLKRSTNNKYDLIIIDVFLATDNGDDITVDLVDSFQHIYRKLTDNGVAVFNQLSKDINSHSGLQGLPKVFSQQILKLNISSTNVISFAPRGQIPNTIPAERYNKLAQISTLPYELNFSSIQPVF